MPSVLRCGAYVVYVYPEVGGQHKLPHCHIRWGENSIAVALPSLVVVAGGALPRDARAVLTENLDLICAAWDELNPGGASA